MLQSGISHSGRPAPISNNNSQDIDSEFPQSIADPFFSAEDQAEPASAALPAEASAVPPSAPVEVASPSVVGSSATPSWVSNLSTASIKSDMSAADVSGTVTYSGLEKLFADVASTLSSTITTLTSAEWSDLNSIVTNLNNGMSTSSYLAGITKALVVGNAANVSWTGGAATSVALGNLATGSSATQLNELIGKWFLGTDLPSSYVSMTGSASFTVSYSAASGPLFGASGPTINDINQGQLGDCFFLCSLGEVANQHTGTIQSMFTTNGNGTYGVRFYENGVATYVTVNTQLVTGQEIFNSGTNIWGSLAEKAYDQLQASGNVTGNTGSGNSWNTIGNGGVTMYALEEITDATQVSDFYVSGSTWSSYTDNQSLHETGYSSGASSSAVQATLLADLKLGDDLLLDSWTDATDSSGKQTLVADHALSIYGFDAQTGMFEVRNPWGTETGQTWETTFEVSLATVLADDDDVVVDNTGTNVPPTPISTTNVHANNLTGIVHANDLTHSDTVNPSYAQYNYIDGLNYIASFGDLINALGANETAGQQHFLAHGILEDRISTFDGLDYVASYQDLTNAFSSAGSKTAVEDDGATHFITHGVNEGRSTTFNGLDYIASYGDLIAAFGADNDAGAYHYIENGSKEGRTTSFDGLDYIASYSDLIGGIGANEQAGAVHFITHGYNEGRTTTFNGLDYIASYNDLIKALGANNDAGATHYINHGYTEGRSISFDGLDYIADYTDLMKAFGANEQAGAAHYITNGLNEGRTTTFNVSAYLAAHTDLAGKYATNDQFLTAYITAYVSTGHYLT